MTEIQARYIQLVKDITQLQWVRESLPSHSKYYEGLKKKLEKQMHLKSFSEKELVNYQKERDHTSSTSKRTLFSQQTNNHTKSFSNIIESVKFYENAIQQLQAQIDQAKIMMDDLNGEKQKLDNLCNQLHQLYDQVIIPDAEDASFIFEQHLKRDVQQLAADIPTMKENIKTYTQAQAKLYQARELIETAMKSLPGASTFMDRQAIVASQNNNHSSSIFGKSAVAISSTIADPIKNAEKIAQQSYQLVQEAHDICDDVPNIPTSTVQKGESNVVYILTNYRGYRLKIEYTLRTQVNPRLHGFENQLSTAKYHYEQRVIEWIDHQIITLEAYLRTNGCLVNENLDVEISRLRMGSRAAIAAVASEVSGRVTVDDVLEIASASDHGVLPEYEQHSDNSSTTSDSSNSSHASHPQPDIPNNAVQCDMMNLPSYADEQRPQSTTSTTATELPPPAYTL
ncbi:uncharacterized protein ATC70_001456 [Mucor velutinosus]|uniref:Uncharacterized protein n=1 Tax=Mucor velutinosus TaxID=708070 RepID=A0AAN7HUI1_9FUNG|nr:hypothetical protein ATC70_001456 [Mucor velutinosus]